MAQSLPASSCLNITAPIVFPIAGAIGRPTRGQRAKATTDVCKLPVAGRYHRALADAEMAASLLRHLEEELRRCYQVREVSHALLRSIQSVPRNKLDLCIDRHRQAA